MDNKLGELLEHPVRLLIQNLHNSNIYSIFAHINLYKNIIWKKNYLILKVDMGNTQVTEYLKVVKYLAIDKEIY